MLDYITINDHSSIRIEAERILYFDPFRFNADFQPHDADVIFVTHDHFDHYSPEDIAKILKDETQFVAPTSTAALIAEAFPQFASQIIAVKPGDTLQVAGIDVEVVAAYNPTKEQFHPKRENWVGYVVTAEGKRHYICGDMDVTEEGKNVKCDVLLLPVGGTYTMDAKEAIELVSAIQPAYAIPTHYGEVAGGEACGSVFAEEISKAGLATEVVMKL
ncbi:MAG: MBL fold metallo-hydrolase [Clostridiales bacterium]|nr:MBL fold metallo-hydrolase [Candidatus Scatonaster coprocaballi]